MKTDLITAIAAGIAGTAIAFFVCNMLLPEIASFSFNKLDSTTTYSLTEPDAEIFNYRSLNPTVEVYVGNCDEYDSYGNCITEKQSDTTTPDNTTPDNTTPETPDITPENVTPDNVTPETPEQESEDGSSD